MPRARAPWWMFFMAATFVGFFALLIYNQFWGPELPGFSTSYGQGIMVVREAAPDSPAGRAGLQSGDRVLAIDGQPIRNFPDWLAVRSNFEVGRPIQFEIQRSNERMKLTMTLARNSPDRWGPRDRFIFATTRGGQLVMLLLALVIAFSRPYDLNARLGAWLLAAGAVASPEPLIGAAATWRHLPVLLGAPLWIAGLSGTVLLAPLFLTFFATFPRNLFRARWTWIAVWVPMLVAALPLLSYFFAMVYRPNHVTGVVPDYWLPVVALIVVGYLVGSMAALAVNYRRLDQINERRRVRVLLLGLIIGWLPMFPPILLNYWEPLRKFGPAYFSSPALPLGYFLFLTFPFSFAYAILRHRLFDIRLMVRQGVQYALARRLLLSLVPALAGLLLLDLLLHGDQPFLSILRARGWIYGGLIGLALLAHRQRERWMESLDQRFFRERYSAEKLLREMVEEIREATNLERVAPRLVARVEAALHPEFVALLVREPQASSYRTLAIAPEGKALPNMAADSKLTALVRLLGKPLEVSLTETSWLKQQLPHEETDFLRRARIDLLVPVAVGANSTEALLALGIKRSEEPYSAQDQELLVALAAGLALLLERPIALPRTDGFEECPQCGTCFDSGAGICSNDNVQLTATSLPRSLAGRYRLEKRLGRGGMGTVYQAVDRDLERNVAIKLIRDDYLSSAEAAERFRRESRAAAGFAHPNVVTVYDFGIDSGNRAFLVMELLHGASLRQEIETQRRLPAGRTLEILRGVTAGVEAAHQRQLIHRDLKPENVFLARVGAAEIPKILDFGISKFLPNTMQATAETGAGVLVGTPQYMSPEQLRGGSVDPSWDIWALSVMAYQMLTGAHPFGDFSFPECHAAVLAGRFKPLAECLPAAPARYDGFFRKVFAADPKQRPATVGNFFSELQNALGSGN